MVCTAVQLQHAMLCTVLLVPSTDVDGIHAASANCFMHSYPVLLLLLCMLLLLAAVVQLPVCKQLEKICTLSPVLNEVPATEEDDQAWWDAFYDN